jgi:hypothetical protein
MRFWIQKCPRCGYCATNISECGPLAREAVQSRQYTEILGELVEGGYPLSSCFEAGAYLCRIHDDVLGQFRHIQSAAWACDDARDNDMAVQYRHECIKVLGQIRATSIDIGHSGGTEAILADLLRRIGQFDKARTECHRALEVASPECYLEEGIRLQLDLIAQGDRSCHRFPEPPPTTEQLQQEDEAQKRAKEARMRRKEYAMGQEALYGRVREAGWKCTHCGCEGVAEKDFRFSLGRHPCVICRKCG